MTGSAPARDPKDLDRADPETEIARAAAAYGDWGRWGEDDRLGTANLITDDHRLGAARLVRPGVPFSLAQSFDENGPFTGAVGAPVNPIALK